MVRDDMTSESDGAGMTADNRWVGAVVGALVTRPGRSTESGVILGAAVERDDSPSLRLATVR